MLFATVLTLLPHVGLAETTQWIDEFVPKRPDGFRIHFLAGHIRSFRIQNDEPFQHAEIVFGEDGVKQDVTVYIGLPLYVNGAPYQCPASPKVGWLEHTFSVCPQLPANLMSAKTRVRLDVWQDRTPAPEGKNVLVTDAITTLPD